MWTVPTIGLSLCVLAGCAPPLLLLVDATHAPTGAGTVTGTAESDGEAHKVGDD